MIRAVPHIAQMAPYALAELTAPPGKTLVSLSQNESLRPPSPHIAAAAVSALAQGNLYPDPQWHALCDALSTLHAVPADHILCGNGSMELIGALTQAFADDTSAVLAPAHAYPFFKTVTQLVKARFDTAPEDNGTVSVDALLKAVRPDTRIVFVANPGNPTGTRIPTRDLSRLRAGLPGDVLLVIDEAYGEFADHLGDPAFDLTKRGNTVVLRTLSKAYGLAGLRVGWGVFPPAIAAEIRKVMNPNNVSLASQAAAVAAITDQDYMRETCALTMDLRDRFIARLRAAGFDIPDSFTNFALIRFANVTAAQSADQALRCEGLITRAQGGAGLPHSLRVTVGPAEALDHAAHLLEQWAKGESL